MSASPPPEQTTQAVRRVKARSQRPSGGPLWLGPALGCLIGVCALVAIGAMIAFRPFKGTNVIESPLVVVTVTATPIMPTVTARPTAAPVATLAPTPTPEGLYIGGNAVVTGTGSALRLRSDPGLQSTTLKTVSDGARLKILEGPRNADDLQWWRLQDPVDGAEGWAAEKYLVPASAP
jgi:hypothetical protein